MEIYDDSSNKRLYDARGSVDSEGNFTIDLSSDFNLKAGQEVFASLWHFLNGDPADHRTMRVEQLKEPSLLGTIKFVTASDGSPKTYFDLYVNDYSGSLPGDVTTITITGPGGPLSYTLNDFTYLPPNDFFLSQDGVPATGTYTFTVEVGGSTLEDTETQDVIRNIPVIDANGMIPSDGEILPTTTPTFIWPKVAYDGIPFYYRLTINDMSDNRVFATRREPDMSYFTVPPGTLQPGQIYKWRVRVTDSGDFYQVQNRSNSAWLTFSVSLDPYPATPPVLIPYMPDQTTDTTPTLEWMEVSGATTYRIEIDDTLAFTEPPLHSATVSGPASISGAYSYTTPTLPLGTYFWRVSSEFNYELYSTPDDFTIEQDRDGDGVPDSIDPFPDDPTEWTDNDSDVIGDTRDSDDDNDGMADWWEKRYQSHGMDPLADDADGDLDGDGHSNLEEYRGCTDPNDSNDYPTTIIKGDLNDDGYLVSGLTTMAPGNQDIYLVKTNDVGNLQWTTSYGGVSYERAYSTTRTADGGYISVGKTESFGSGLGDVYMVKTDSSGRISWSKTYGGSDVDYGRAVVEAPDGGYLIVGSTRSFGAGNSDVYVVKTNESGDTE